MGTLLGILIGLGLITYSVIASWEITAKATETLTLSKAFINTPGFLLVIGGVIAATLVSFPLKDVIESFLAFFRVFFRKEHSFIKRINDIAETSALHTKNGISALEEKVKNSQMSFYRDALEMFVNGYKKEEIVRVCEDMINARYEREVIQADVFKVIARSAPAFGMIGTVVGMIGMFGKMAEKFRLEATAAEAASVSGSGGAGIQFTIFFLMMVALTTTFYGLIIANLVFSPMANKIVNRSDSTRAYLYMTLKGVLLICDKKHPLYIKDILIGYLPPQYRKQLYKEIEKESLPAAAAPAKAGKK